MAPAEDLGALTYIHTSPLMEPVGYMLPTHDMQKIRIFCAYKANMVYFRAYLKADMVNHKQRHYQHAKTSIEGMHYYDSY